MRALCALQGMRHRRPRGSCSSPAYQIFDLVPAAPTLILQVVLQKLPHKRQSKEVHQHYLRSTFRLAELPQALSMRDGLLLGVIIRLLEAS